MRKLSPPSRRIRALSQLAAGLIGSVALLAHAAPEQRVIVKYADAPLVGALGAPVSGLLSSVQTTLGVQLEPMRTLAIGAQLVGVEGRRLTDAELAGLARTIAAQPGVEFAEPDLLLQRQFTPNDSNYSSQWHYFEATGGLNLPDAWDTTDGSGTIVAVLDTGYRPHADLNANIVGGYDMIGDTFVSNDGNGRDSDARDPGDAVTAGECGGGEPAQDQGSSWHGTHVAGTIAAVTNNNTGVAGVAFGAKVVPVRVLGKCGGYTSDIADGIVWAAGGTVSGVPANANPAQVLNLSLGGGGACSSTSQNAINTARSLGATVVVAAGNSNVNASNANPANCSGVVTVAATNRNGGRAYYSNFGNVVDVAAPGGDIRASSSNGVLSTLNAGQGGPGADNYAYYQGTSMATPHVAGVAAMLYAVDPDITPDQVESTLASTTRSFPATCSGCGTGIVDAAAAVAAASGTGGGGGDTVLENGVAKTGLSAGTGGELAFTMDVPAGATDLNFAISGGSGDADLYVNFGSPATTSDYDCRPYIGGNNETCDFASPQAGTWHVMVRGYSAYSGVSLVGSYTESGSGGGGACPTGFTEYSDSLSGTGNSDYQPDGSWYLSNSSGTHAGTLAGAAGTDFDLYVQKWNGSRWSNVGSSTSASSTESISYNGTSGYYRWRIYSYSGSGAYTFCLSNP